MSSVSRKPAPDSWDTEPRFDLPRWTLPASAGLIALSAMFFALCGGPSGTDEQQIDRLIDEVVEAVSKRDVGDIFAHVSERYRSREGWDRNQLRGYLAAQLLRGEWAEAFVTNRDIRVTGHEAVAEVTATLSRGGESGARVGSHRITVGFEREGGDWRVVSSERRDAGVGDFLR